jgi:hypothetical protein
MIQIDPNQMLTVNSAGEITAMFACLTEIRQDDAHGFARSTVRLTLAAIRSARAEHGEELGIKRAAEIARFVRAASPAPEVG